MVELVDTLVLGTSAEGVGLTPLSAPRLIMVRERNIVAIGGGGFGRDPGEGIIEEYILKQTKKNLIFALFLLQLVTMKPIK